MKALYALAAACVIATGAAAPALAAASTELGIAASMGDTGRIKGLVGAGQNLNARDAEGYSPLMWAALNGQVNAVATLITLGANLNIQDNEGYTALMWATQNKHALIVRQLVNAGASVNLRDSHGYTALHWAAQDGQLAIAQTLLQHGADPNARDIEGYTPLMWAAQQGHKAVTYELLAAGANPGFKDRRGYNAYDLANAYYHTDIRKLIKEFRPRADMAWRGYMPARRPMMAEYGGLVPMQPMNRPMMDPRAYNDPRPMVREARPVPLEGAPMPPRRPVMGGQSWGAGWQPAAPPMMHIHHHHPIMVPAQRVNMQSGVKPSLVAVVNTPDSPYWSGPDRYTPASVKAAVWGSQLENRLAKFDVDKNAIIDGRDWRNLTMTTSRIALATLLHEQRCGKHNCTTHHINSIMNKLDWTYTLVNRQELTLNQAWDLPSFHTEPIRW